MKNNKSLNKKNNYNDFYIVQRKTAVKQKSNRFFGIILALLLAFSFIIPMYMNAFYNGQNSNVFAVGENTESTSNITEDLKNNDNQENINNNPSDINNSDNKINGNSEIESNLNDSSNSNSNNLEENNGDINSNGAPSATVSGTTMTINGSGEITATIVRNALYPQGQSYQTITKVIINDSGITSIGRYAFERCSNLRSIDLSKCNSLTTIGDGAFYGCSNLSSIDLSKCNSLQTIGSSAFYECSNLNSIDLSNCSALTAIERSAFHGCSNLSSIDLSKCSSLQTIGNGAFYGCSNLSSIDLSKCNSLQTIGSMAFQICSNLRSIDLSKCSNLKTIGSQAFFECFNLMRLILPRDKKVIKDGTSAVGDITIGDFAFKENMKLVEVVTNNNDIDTIKTVISYNVLSVISDLIDTKIMDIDGHQIYKDKNKTLYLGYLGNSTNVVLPSKDKDSQSIIYSINSEAFYNSELQGITIPKFVTSIGSSAFKNCKNLNILKIDGGATENGKYVSPEGSNVIMNSTTLKFGCNGSKIPKNITHIGYDAFAGSGITKLDLNGCDNLTVIEQNAFYECSNLSSIDISKCNSLTTIGDSAFTYCSGLSDIVIPSKVSIIKQRAFRWCSNLSSIDLSKCSNLQTIGDSAFSYCSGLSGIIIPSKVSTIGVCTFQECSNLSSIDLSKCSTLTAIERFAFYGCSNLSSIDLSKFNGLTTIGENAFCQCSNLGSIDLSGCSSLTTIGEDAFSYCSNLGSIDLSGCSSLTTIGKDAFRDCSGLRGKIVIPSKVSIIGEGAFNECSNVEEIYVDKSNETYTSRDSTGKECNVIMTIATAPDSNTVLLGCSNSIIPNNASIIGGYAFSQCSELYKLIIPQNIKKMESSAIYYCDNLKEVVFCHEDIKNLMLSNNFNPYYNSIKFYYIAPKTSWDSWITNNANNLNGHYKNYYNHAIPLNLDDDVNTIEYYYLCGRDDESSPSLKDILDSFELPIGHMFSNVWSMKKNGKLIDFSGNKIHYDYNATVPGDNDSITLLSANIIKIHNVKLQFNLEGKFDSSVYAIIDIFNDKKGYNRKIFLCLNNLMNDNNIVYFGIPKIVNGDVIKIQFKCSDSLTLTGKGTINSSLKRWEVQSTSDTEETFVITLKGVK